MDNYGSIQKFYRGKIKGAIRTGAILLLTMLAVWNITGQDTPVYSFFQSPISPPATPTPAPPPTDTPIPPPPAATDTPVPPAPAESQAVPEATATIVIESTGEIQGGAVPQAESEQPEFTPTIAAITPNPLAPIVPQATEVVPVIPSKPRPAVDSSAPTGGRVVNEAKLIDTLITWTAKSVLCLGGVVLLLLLISLPLLYRRGKKLNQDNTD